MAPPRANALGLLVALFVLLPFKLVAQISIAISAIVFVVQPFEAARLYALIAVSVVHMLAKLHRKLEAQRTDDTVADLTSVLQMLERLGRVYHLSLIHI